MLYKMSHHSVSAFVSGILLGMVIGGGYFFIRYNALKKSIQRLNFSEHRQISVADDYPVDNTAESATDIFEGLHLLNQKKASGKKWTSRARQSGQYSGEMQKLRDRLTESGGPGDTVQSFEHANVRHADVESLFLFYLTAGIAIIVYLTTIIYSKQKILEKTNKDSGGHFPEDIRNGKKTDRK